MYDIFKLFVIITFSVLLSACPEAGSDIRTYCRTDTLDPNTLDADGNPVKIGDILRTYVPVDGIQYAISGVSNSIPTSGTLTVDWGVNGKYTLLQNPINNTAITTLQERAELKSITGIPGNSSTTYRYIEQDTSGSTKGSMYLWAFSDEDGPGVNYYWTNDSLSIVTDVKKISIFDSPVDTVSLAAAPLVKDIEHYPMEGCNPTSNNCIAKIATFTEKDTTTKSTIVETRQGTFFEAYEIDISNATVTRTGLNPIQRIPIPLDFRHACSTGANSDVINFNGKMWLFPEVGIVKYQINCTSSNTANVYSLTFDFLNSNIPLPAGVSGDQNTACN